MVYLQKPKNMISIVPDNCRDQCGLHEFAAQPGMDVEVSLCSGHSESVLWRSQMILMWDSRALSRT